MELASKHSHDLIYPPKPPLQQCPNLPILDHLRFLLILTLALLESTLILLRTPPIYHITPILFIILYLSRIYYLTRPPKVFLVDFSCYKPPSTCRIPFSSFMEHIRLVNSFDEESIDFMSKVLHSSGQGQETCLPPSLHFLPPRSTHPGSLDEARMVLFPVMADLLGKASLSPRDVDVLIVNCSGFCPSPSLASLVVNEFKLQPGVKSFNLSGMGCSASAIAVSLAQSILSARRETNAVILSTEVLTMGWYPGNEKPKLVLNCVFRMGGAAVLLSNRGPAQRGSKYRVLRTLREARSHDDAAYRSAFREEDSNGLTGVALNKDILGVAADLIRAQLTVLGSSMLPLPEKVLFLSSVLRKKLLNRKGEVYVPNFKAVIRHFCLPVSGRPLIREIGRGMRLGERELEPALATLHRFGNQSSSSLWYELAYLEAKERVKEGERVWMLGMGSGPKSNTVVLECNRPIVGESNKGPWADCIHSYPLGTI